MVVAVYGGSFDPPHRGHLRAAERAVAQIDPDLLLVVPAYRHAFGKHLADFDHRLIMTRLTFSKRIGRAVVDVSDVERTWGCGRTIDLLQVLGRRFESADLRLVIGEDVLAEVARWHRWEEVRRLAPPLVVPRDGCSSTKVRGQMARGEPTPDLLDDVAAYARSRGLYKAARD